ncbi:unnamed protein product [Caenorhabditis auriculariae]|uniref:Uncharacterized protein n=1 Tax=Caenorhabditis auriculariae TaxID=2777116 RepID=A0A8S1HLV7_9PELO|nr:unnamed protein product [Caenorhabditis auriculariae]
MVDRGDRVSYMLFRSVFCCSRPNKVSEKELVVPDVSSEQLQTVFVVTMPSVIGRGLIGKLMRCLEDMKMAPLNMRMLVPPSSLIGTSAVMKVHRKNPPTGVYVASLWKGREAQVYIDEALRKFRHRFGIHKNDVLYTFSSIHAENEGRIWFPLTAADPVPVETLNEAAPAPIAVATREEEEEKKEDFEEAKSEQNGVIAVEPQETVEEPNGERPKSIDSHSPQT